MRKILVRKIFRNKNNGQLSLTLPSRVATEQIVKNKKYPKKVKIKIKEFLFD